MFSLIMPVFSDITFALNSPFSEAAYKSPCLSKARKFNDEDIASVFSNDVKHQIDSIIMKYERDIKENIVIIQTTVHTKHNQKLPSKSYEKLTRRLEMFNEISHLIGYSSYIIPFNICQIAYFCSSSLNIFHSQFSNKLDIVDFVISFISL